MIVWVVFTSIIFSNELIYSIESVKNDFIEYIFIYLILFIKYFIYITMLTFYPHFIKS